MTSVELLFDAAVVILAAYIGWLARGVFEFFKTRRRDRAWKRTRHFLPSDTSKT
ncbi:MAG TPA: hypothetical protein VKC60_00365 [Opitutaceae bacterium]|nr:hypothetical protein [Opitutaceae bacterium]